MLKIHWSIALGIGVIIIASFVIVILHKKAEKMNAQDDVKCLHDTDCRRRLEAAVNQIYSEIGYDEVYTAPQ
jgi:hypothetical protein